SDAYHMTMDRLRADDRVKAALGDDLTDSFWLGGHLNVNANGAGDAQFGIPVHGAKARARPIRPLSGQPAHGACACWWSGSREPMRRSC
ncbi:cytochrome c oxidase assembly factor Coa1 family protein, partial [Mesorhizobium sp.]|uniref:cytochrome c oxidase assembly factor Coa1 family protein n=1 Tax=Mesorhizobium sp. TaxID=1871066 RepID=UPI0025C2207E